MHPPENGFIERFEFHKKQIHFCQATPADFADHPGSIVALIFEIGYNDNRLISCRDWTELFRRNGIHEVGQWVSNKKNARIAAGAGRLISWMKPMTRQPAIRTFFVRIAAVAILKIWTRMNKEQLPIPNRNSKQASCSPSLTDRRLRRGRIKKSSGIFDSRRFVFPCNSS